MLPTHCFSVVLSSNGDTFMFSFVCWCFRCSTTWFCYILLLARSTSSSSVCVNCLWFFCCCDFFVRDIVESRVDTVYRTKRFVASAVPWRRRLWWALTRRSAPSRQAARQKRRWYSFFFTYISYFPSRRRAVCLWTFFLLECEPLLPHTYELRNSISTMDTLNY